jgi:transposase-like protein
MKRKSYSADFKQDAVSRMAHAKTVTGLAKELGDVFGVRRLKKPRR